MVIHSHEMREVLLVTASWHHRASHLNSSDRHQQPDLQPPSDAVPPAVQHLRSFREIEQRGDALSDCQSCFSAPSAAQPPGAKQSSVMKIELLWTHFAFKASILKNSI